MPQAMSDSGGSSTRLIQYQLQDASGEGTDLDVPENIRFKLVNILRHPILRLSRLLFYSRVLSRTLARALSNLANHPLSGVSAHEGSVKGVDQWQQNDSWKLTVQILRAAQAPKALREKLGPA